MNKQKIFSVEASGLIVNIANNCGERTVLNANSQLLINGEVTNGENDADLREKLNSSRQTTEYNEKPIDDNSNISADGHFKEPLQLLWKRPKVLLPEFMRTKCATTIKEDPRKQRLGIETIFPDVCFHFLQGECVYDDDCIDIHTLPTSNEIRERLNGLDVVKASQLFNVIVMRCKILVYNGLEAFADYFATQRYQNGLIKMIYFVEDERYNITSHFKTLIRAFIQSGFTYTETLKTILLYHTKQTKQSLSVLFNYSLYEGVQLADFLATFMLLTYQRDYLFPIQTINALLMMCNYSNNILQFAQVIDVVFQHNAKYPNFEIDCLDEVAYQKFLRKLSSAKMAEMTF